VNAEDRIETVGAGIDAVTDHMIVTVVTLSVVIPVPRSHPNTFSWKK
jgi:hypothetical protein